MKKTFTILFILIFIFNIAVFADETADSNTGEILLSYSTNIEYTSGSALIKLTGQPSEGFSYNSETDFLQLEEGIQGFFIKELDSNIEVNEKALVLNTAEGMDLTLPYCFRAFAYVYTIDRDKNLHKSQPSFSPKDGTAILAEAVLEFNGDKVQFTLRKIRTSIEKTIGSENIGEVLTNNLLLVNRSNRLDRNYFPDDLIYGKPIRGRSAVSLRLNREALKQFNSMLETAYQEGISGMVVTSAFRTYDKQTSLYNNKTSLLSRKMNRKTALEEASKIVAIPGSSEHQTGLAVDISSESVGLVKGFGNTRQGKWIKNNSKRFGFVVRYPEDKTAVTGIIYEPWHVRYVGVGHSEIMERKGFCLEEYVEYLRNNRLIYFGDSSGADYVVQYINKEAFGSEGMTISLPESSSWSISNCTKSSYILTIKL